MINKCIVVGALVFGVLATCEALSIKAEPPSNRVFIQREIIGGGVTGRGIWRRVSAKQPEVFDGESETYSDFQCRPDIGACAVTGIYAFGAGTYETQARLFKIITWTEGTKDDFRGPVYVVAVAQEFCSTTELTIDVERSFATLMISRAGPPSGCELLPIWKLTKPETFQLIRDDVAK